MARAGLGSRWHCRFANDNDERKAASYARNWGAEGLRVADVADLTTADLPDSVDLAWASFPCQDLSLAGSGVGLKGARSSTFWPFWNLVKALRAQGRAPTLVVLENVYGALRSHEGMDFAQIGNSLAASGYRFGAIVADAIHFVPQSRPRLFVIGVSSELKPPRTIEGDGPTQAWHPAAVAEAREKLSPDAQAMWIWWNPGRPPRRQIELSDLIEDPPKGVEWHSEATTQRLLGLMSRRNLDKVNEACEASHPMVGGLYKRTRGGRQRAEVRFDVAGCLRTPSGGSSRQTILIADGAHVRSRLLSPREAARLMGLPDTYVLPENYNEAYHLAGDGLVVPVVRFLAGRILEPVVRLSGKGKEQAA